MNHRTPLALAATIALTVSAIAVHRPLRAAEPAQAPAATIAEGKHTFVAIGCYQCHGYAGQGAQGTGPSLVPLRLGDDQFTHYLRAPRGVMPAFSAKLLPQTSIGPLLAYIHSLPVGRPPSQIPLLAHYVVGVPAHAAAMPAKTGKPPVEADGTAGKPLYAANCAACHGDDLQGVIGPSLKQEGTKRTVDQIVALVLAPPPGMPNLSPPLTTAQVRMIATYVHAPH